MVYDFLNFSLHFLIVHRYRELREFNFHIIGRAEQDALFGCREHGDVIIGIADGNDLIIQILKSSCHLSFTIFLAQVISGN